MMGLKCKNCESTFVPPITVCRNCGSRRLKEFETSDKGEIITWTRIHIPPSSRKGQEPYFLAIIQLEDGARLVGKIEDLEENPNCGDKVKYVENGKDRIFKKVE